MYFNFLIQAQRSLRLYITRSLNLIIDQNFEHVLHELKTRPATTTLVVLIMEGPISQIITIIRVFP